MKVITQRPIYTEPTSNCCGMSGADGTYSNCGGGCSGFDSYSNCCGMSGADGSYSNCCGMSNADGDLKELIQEGKNYLSEQKSERQSARTTAVKNTLNDRSIRKQTKRDQRALKQTERQVNRSGRKEARFQRRQDKKAKKNAKKLVLIKTQGRERYFFPLSRIRLGKKKYKDGTTADVKTADQITITTPSGEVATFDKNEIAKAMGTSANAVTKESLQLYLFPVPKPISDEQGLSKELAQDPNEKVYSLETPENLLETGNDGELYLSQDLQNTNEPEKDVKDEEKGLSKTQKIVLWTAGAVVLGIVGYIIYKSVTKSKSSN